MMGGVTKIPRVDPAGKHGAAVCHKPPPFLPPRNAKEEGTNQPTNQRTVYRVTQNHFAYLKLVIILV